MSNLKSRASFKIGLIIGVLCLITHTSQASQADLDKELQAYIDIYTNDDFFEQKEAFKKLGYAGISDERLFDLMENKLLDTYTQKGKKNAEQGSWYAKGLALSGNLKYQSTLVKVADKGQSKKIRKNATLALVRIKEYESWNSVIAKGLVDTPSGLLAQARVENMLLSKDPALIKLGSKRVYFGHTSDVKLLDLVSQVLDEGYQRSEGNDEKVDAMAWLIRTLAESGNDKYKAQLVDIKKSAENKKIKKYAKKYADYL